MLWKRMRKHARRTIGHTRRGQEVYEIAGGDNVTVDNGGLTDFTAATDTIAGVDYQYVKLVSGLLDSTEKIEGTAANGLEVDVTRIATGSKIQLTDGTDEATISVAGSRKPLDVHLIDSSGAVISTFGGAGGTSSTDDADFTALATVGTPGMGVYESTPTSVTDGDMGILGIDVNRRVKVSLDASTLDVAHDAVDSGNPTKIGSKASNALPTAVANADRANAISDLFGRILTAHIDPAMQVHKNKTYTSQQTGSAIWDPTAGKKIAITSVVIGTYGTTSGRIIIWFGDNADTTFTQDTDQVLVAASFAPSTTSKPGLIYSPATPVYCTTADREVHVTSDAGISFDLTLEGYEF